MESHPLDNTPSVRHADVIVVGAGIFGTTIAIALAQQSRSVFLLERSLKEPNRIVGELLQPGGVRALENLGLQQCLHGIESIPVQGYHIIHSGRPVSIRYPVDESTGYERREGRSFHHGRFIQQLRAVARAEPNITVIETEVNGTLKAEDTNQVVGVKTRTKDGTQDYFFAHLTVIADGYNSKFREENCPTKPVSKSKFWALELQDVTLPCPHFGHVILGDFSPVLLYQIGKHETRALVDVPNDLQSAEVKNGGVAGYMRNVILPHLPDSVQASFEKSLGSSHLRCMRNSFLPATSNRVPGLIIAGDAMNMRHPLTGGGMTVALNDVVLLKELLSPSNVPDLSNTQLVLRQMKAFHWQRKNLASVINILAQVLYSVFAAEDYSSKALRRGCLKYFKRGGACVDGPAGLLAGITRKPLVLMYHFFAVALLSMWILLLSQPGWRLPLTVLECGGVFLKACRVLFPYIVFELSN